MPTPAEAPKLGATAKLDALPVEVPAEEAAAAFSDAPAPVPPASPVEAATPWAFETANAVTLPEPDVEPTAGWFAALEPETDADPVATPKYP